MAAAVVSVMRSIGPVNFSVMQAAIWSRSADMARTVARSSAISRSAASRTAAT
jgi:hypothetical protein